MAANVKSRQPNIVFILTDDLGWRHVGYHGGGEHTPNIDRIAREGVELDRFYAAPLCSPTRAAALTGRHPHRFGVGCSVITPRHTYGVPSDERMLPEVLADAGYKRRGCFGKWHLGHGHVGHHPLRRGFTHFYGCYNGAVDHFTHERDGELDWHRGYGPAREEGYDTDLITDEVVTFIDESPADEPFFAYVPYTAPHSPLQAPKQYLDMFPDRDDKERTYAAMVACMDHGVGRILKAIDDKGVSDDTLVIFLSDNGAGIGGENAPLRGRKASVFDGGIRTIACMRWPAGGLVGGRKVETPMQHIDILPTCMALAGITNHGGKPLDGINLLPCMRGANAPDRPIYSFVGYGDRDQLAVMESGWKLIYMGPPILDTDDPYTDGERLLFRIDDDPCEQNDLAETHPEVVRRLLPKLKMYRSWHCPDHCLFTEPLREKGFHPPKDWLLPEMALL